MSTYKELRAKLESNHAVCKQIESELQTMQPDEIWVCFFKEKIHKAAAFPSEKEAREHCACIVEKVVRYVLPNQEPPCSGV